MTETPNTPASTDSQTAETPPQGPTVESLQAEVEKWKSLSRTNEKRWNDASSELERIRQESMTDAEKAIEAAKAEARNAALAEVGTRLVDAELRAQAAAAGVELPSADFLNMSRFLGSDGSVDTAAVTAFVSSLPKPAAGPAFRQDIGLGRQGEPAAGQLTRDDLSRMTPREINEARKAGKLDALLRGEI
ncbi:hypothetical protein HKX69_05810 [Streptomyces argyrophyllae]|uniref:Scaffolding protein n=1 Tax=Streptomyces argyrophylli TaxID=2726118 RepID=A0A6M4PFA2_9ACTN|nr:hypothetical protein [Streptomyces argyrophyllae]QJS09094.1 hypothetical protein HKX69_05810 [Streptomyces argyrophyllae]